MSRMSRGMLGHAATFFILAVVWEPSTFFAFDFPLLLLLAIGILSALACLRWRRYFLALMEAVIRLLLGHQGVRIAYTRLGEAVAEGPIRAVGEAGLIYYEYIDNTAKEMRTIAEEKVEFTRKAAEALMERYTSAGGLPQLPEQFRWDAEDDYEMDEEGDIGEAESTSKLERACHRVFSEALERCKKAHELAMKECRDKMPAFICSSGVPDADTLCHTDTAEATAASKCKRIAAMEMDREQRNDLLHKAEEKLANALRIERHYQERHTSKKEEEEQADHERHPGELKPILKEWREFIETGLDFFRLGMRVLRFGLIASAIAARCWSGPSRNNHRRPFTRALTDGEMWTHWLSAMMISALLLMFCEVSRWGVKLLHEHGEIHVELGQADLIHVEVDGDGPLAQAIRQALNFRYEAEMAEKIAIDAPGVNSLPDCHNSRIFLLLLAALLLSILGRTMAEWIVNEMIW